MWKKSLLFSIVLVFGSVELVGASSLQRKVTEFCSEVAPSDSLMKYTMDDAIKFLKDEGFVIQKVNDKKARMKVNGSKLLLVRFDDGDFQLYFGVTGLTIGCKRINTWNRKYRLSRAYLDKDGDPAIEADLDNGEGLTKGQLVHFVKVFTNTTLPRFITFLRQQ